MAPRWTFLCAGLWMLLALGRGHFPEEDQQRIVHLHNHHRSMVEPPAANMIRMKWSEELAVTAQDYATKCKWEHNPELQNLMGENLFITTGPLDIEKGLNDWFVEHEDYTYDNNTCAEDTMCGHYTQMVWATTKTVGCGSHLCETVEGLDFKDATIMVCNYHPPGNVIGHKPYEEGDQCTKCPYNLQDCVDRACDHTDRDEPPSLEPTELWVTDIPHSVSVESDDIPHIYTDHELPSLEPTEPGEKYIVHSRTVDPEVIRLIFGDRDELPSLEPVKPGETDIVHSRTVDPEVIQLIFGGRDELPSVEPTELWMTDMPHYVSDMSESGSGRPSAALLLITGLLASLLLL